MALGYPSLWGNSTGILFEYAAPLPFNWAFAHLVSMLPLAILIYGLPLWPHRRLVQFRWVMVAALVVLFFIEVRLPHGRLNHIPFALFLIVDCLAALVISLMFRPPIKWIIGTLLILTAATFLLRYINNYDGKTTENRSRPALESERPEPVSNSFFENSNQFQRAGFVELDLTIRGIVGPEIGPKPDEICEEAKAFAIRVQKNSKLLVIFMAYPWFEAEEKYIYAAGSANLELDGSWNCKFTYPAPGP